ncbi:MAG: amino acid adenylation domain-containing protein [Actinophytocola sp.]|uniref:amino acid adenylation domain-containing protein n=1 Tax=Actinophytocola sp. TaxID=1872138 RepID=UPI003D6A88C0
MTTILEQNRRAHADQDHVGYWRRAVESEPTTLVRDHLGQDTDAPTATATARLATPALARARRVTREDPALLRVLHGAVVALVAARATDAEHVTTVVAAPSGAAGSALPLSVPVKREDTFRDLLMAARTAYLDAASHTAAPYWLFYDQAAAAPSDVALAVEGDLSPPDAAAVGCTLYFAVLDDRVDVTYRSDSFTSSTAERLAADFAALLEKTTNAMDAPIGPLLDAGPDAQRRLGAFNDTGAEFPATTLLHQFLERGAAKHPDRIAIAGSGTSDGLTYARLNARANRLAHRLRELGVGRGDIVGVCLPRSPRELTAIYAVLKAGGAYLPVDPALPRNRIDYLLEHSGTRIVLGDHLTRPAVTEATIFVDLDDERSFADAESDPETVAGPRDLCYVIYTSGSTGRPKGVMVEHTAIVNRLAWMQRAYPLAGDDVILHKTPFTFDVSVWEIFWWSLAGAAVATLPSGDERDPRRIVEHIAGHGITTMHFVPSMLQAFLRYVAATGTACCLPSLRRVFASGEALTTAQALRFRELLGHAGLVNLYGPTEAAVDVTCFDCAELDPRRPVPIGQPIDNIVLHVLTKAGTVAPIGTPGELCIAGVGLARGYLNAPDLTGQRFVADPFRPGERMYRTGDLARWLPDGTIEFLGRIDTQVKIRGHRIEPGEIEHVACRVPGVADCAVAPLALGGEDTDDDRVLCAYVVAGEDFDHDEFRAALAAELPSYMVPQWTMPVPAIPTNHNGKRDLGRLPRPDVAARSAYAPPRTAVERRLCDIWADVLGADRVGVRDNFFALGGDSIKGIAVLSSAHAAGLEFSFQNLFAHPSVAELAAFVSERHTGSAARSQAHRFALLDDADRRRLPHGVEDAYPMSSLQTGLLYEAARAEPGSGLYHDILSYHIDGTVDVETFRRAATTVAARHQVFRTSFHLDGFSEPLQLVHDRIPCPLGVFDLSGRPESEQDERLREFAALELTHGFRPGEPDMVRVYLHLLGERGFRYTLSYHDAALDGWSVNTIHRDIFDTYFALLDGHAPDPAPPAVGYGDFVRLERDAQASGHQRDHWLDVLATYDETRLPRLGPTGATGVVIHDVNLSANVTADVVRTAASLRVPVKSVLLAAHVAVLGFVAGTDTVRTGYEHSGRPEVADGERLPGLFLNTVPFGARCADGTWSQLVREVYQTETELLPFRRYPMQEMKRAAGTREPLFETVFNFTHFHVLKELSARDGFGMVRSVVNAQTEFPFRAEFAQDAITDRVELALHYHAAAFDPQQIERIGGYYARALELLTSQPDRDVRAEPLLGHTERALLAEIGAGPPHVLPDATFVDLFAEQVERTPANTALVHGEARLSYRDLDAAADRVAASLSAHGVGRSTVVTTVQERGVDWALTVLAVLKLGAVYLPQDPSYPAERIGAVLRRSGCRHVVTDDVFAAPLRDTLAKVLDEPPTVLTATADGAPRGSVVAPRPDDPAYIIFTSGSTGEPKGAMIHHRGMLNHLWAKVVDLELTGTDRIAQLATQCFDISVWQLLAAWLVGGTTVVVPQDVVTDVPALLRNTVADGDISVLEVVPSYLDALLAEAELRPVDLPALRHLLVTGEALPPALTRRWFSLYRVPLVNAYGPTEASDDVTHHVLTGPVDGERVPVGRAVLNTGLHVVGPDDRPRPIGSYGEIVVTGVGVGLGYVHDPGRTAAAFQPNVLDDRSATMYRTGDVGRWLLGGVLDCAGRLDHQVKVRGFRIELSEVEGALGQLPGVDHAVVVVRNSGGEKLLAAFYTGPAQHDLAAVREALTARLPSYLHPDSVRRLDAFPLTGNGKVDRAALERLPVEETTRVREAPRDELEGELAELFAEVLGLEAAEVGVTDNFFDLGGHSIAAMKVAVRLDGAIGLHDLLAGPTVRALAAGMREQRETRRDLLVDLTAAAGLDVVEPKLTIVCVPFAGGGAVSYIEFARRVHAADAKVRVLGVELPGRSRTDRRAPVPADRLGGELAGEIAARVDTPVALLGHCAGTGPALTTAYALRDKGIEVRRLFVVAKLLRSTKPADHDHNEVTHMSDEEILRWLATNTGFTEPHGMRDADRSDLARAFRYDTAEATRAFALALRDSDPLSVPVVAVLAADDSLASGHEDLVGTWERFGPLDVVVSPEGGHYLNMTRPELLAACVLRSVDGEACADGEPSARQRH